MEKKGLGGGGGGGGGGGVGVWGMGFKERKVIEKAVDRVWAREALIVIEIKYICISISQYLPFVSLL